MTHKTAQSIRDAADQLSAGALPIDTIATNLRAYAESVDRVEHELVRLRSAASSVAVAITQLHENSLLMLNVVETRQPRAADVGKLDVLGHLNEIAARTTIKDVFGESPAAPYLAGQSKP